MDDSALASPPNCGSSVEQIRRFNRFYTRLLGLLREKLLDSPFSLTEASLLFEIADRGETTARTLVDGLGLDPGYLSRVLKSLERRGLIERRRSRDDARRRLITLTSAGREAFSALDGLSREQAQRLLDDLPPERRERLVDAMQSIQRTLETAPPPAMHSVTLRRHRPGDIGWAIHRHGVLYRQQFGWDGAFEGLVAAVLGKFAQHHDAERERSWIAEIDGHFAGCVFVMTDGPGIARLRCLLVEPWARGSGLGSRLVDECIRFAREAGYQRLVLWTNSVLDSARRIYQRAGFSLIEEKPHDLFGEGLIGQTWRLDL